jgi:hypothetical protein
MSVVESRSEEREPAISLPFFLVLTLLLVTFAANAPASEYTYYADWQSLSADEKKAYVSGVLDLLVQKIGDDRLIGVAVEECRFGGWNLNEVDVIEAVERLYSRYVGLHKESVALVVYLATVQKCEKVFKRVMSAAGREEPSFSALLQRYSTPAGSAPH